MTAVQTQAGARTLTGARAIRRMVLDISPWGWFWLSVAVLLVLALDRGWATTPGDHLAGVTLSFVVPAGGLVSMAKMPSWRLLPATERQLARAQWWRIVGAPVLLLAACLVSAVTWAALSGDLRASQDQLLTLFTRQVALAAVVPLTLMGFVPVSGRLGRVGGAALVLLLLIVAIAALLPVPAAPATLGVLALLAVSCLVYIRGIPLLPVWGRSKPRPGSVGWSPKGWLGLAPLMGRIVLAQCLTLLVMWVLSLLLRASPDITLILLPVLLPMSYATGFRRMARALGSLPLGPPILSLGLNGVVLVNQLLLAAFVQMITASAIPPSHLVWMLGVSACQLAWLLRSSGHLRSALIYGAGILVMNLPAIHVDWPGRPDLSSIPLTLGAMLFVAGCAWTGLELARGHRVWRPLPEWRPRWSGRGR